MFTLWSSGLTNLNCNVEMKFEIRLRLKVSILRWKRKHGGQEAEKKNSLPLLA